LATSRKMLASYDHSRNKQEGHGRT
jgi:hypothetical protein